MNGHEPNTNIGGERCVVHALTEPEPLLPGAHRRTPTGCECVEFRTELSVQLHGGEEGWQPCGLPAFAILYQGHADEHGDYMPAFCWRHLRMLGDTRDLIVKPL